MIPTRGLSTSKTRTKPFKPYKINMINDHQWKGFAKSGLVYSKCCTIISTGPTNLNFTRRISKARFLNNLRSFNIHFKEKKEITKLEKFQYIGRRLKSLRKMSMKFELCLAEKKIKMSPFVFLRRCMRLKKIEIEFNWCVWMLDSSTIKPRKPILYTRCLEGLSISSTGDFGPVNTYFAYLPLLTCGKSGLPLKQFSVKLDE